MLPGLVVRKARDIAADWLGHDECAGMASLGRGSRRLDVLVEVDLATGSSFVQGERVRGASRGRRQWTLYGGDKKLVHTYRFSKTNLPVGVTVWAATLRAVTAPSDPSAREAAGARHPLRPSAPSHGAGPRAAAIDHPSETVRGIR